VLIESKGKDHEIPAVQRLIEELDLAGCIFTLDALHLQKNS
jgi:predicted transposase YbfD/YdcC